MIKFDRVAIAQPASPLGLVNHIFAYQQPSYYSSSTPGHRCPAYLRIHTADPDGYTSHPAPV